MAITRMSQPRNVLSQMAHPILTLAGAGVLTLAFFIVLPILQTITEPIKSNDLYRVDSFQTEPPPPAPLEQEEPEPEPEPEEAPPELANETPQMSLDDIQLALNPGFSGGIGNAASFQVRLNLPGSGGGDAGSEMFSVGQLDQKPRPISQPLPSIPPKLKRRLPATVKLIFVVDERGRVVNPKVRSSSDPDFNDLALRAVQGWNYEPGKSGGQAVRFPIAQSITFEAG